MMRVLGRLTSINVRKVVWALEAIDQPYEQEDWGMPLRDPKVPEFLALNPNGQVPVLVDGDFALWESNAILIYLADKAGGGQILPSDPRERARALQWLGWQVSDLNPVWMYAIFALVRKLPGHDDQKQIDNSIQRWTARMQILEAELARGGPFIVGGQFSIADIALGLSCHRWFQTPFEKVKLPAVEDYCRRLKADGPGSRWMAAEYN
ncbi:glutathione S-transferase family protein [Devosia faecipullorum]|uniref:glutathione S-transferase family protein n=1 Tax=Devosia faecipullorum TaxID=2755039 RepID=UPI00187B701E|nr:glutathione S-transferase family protein [Devosia faecipullorum]MBE7733166.1 glutathione S-transferase family protein [Devosia faecipullorum]